MRTARRLLAAVSVTSVLAWAWACASDSSARKADDTAAPTAAAPATADAGLTAAPAVEPDAGAAPVVPDAGAPPAPAPEAQSTAPAAEAPRADGAACSRGDQCQSGVCEGMGCGADEARCAPAQRGCTKDLKPYCGCDGATFRASGTCPRRPYRQKGACP